MLGYNPALMRFRITIEHKVVTQNTEGLQTNSWAVLASNVPAGIEGLTGKEIQAVGQPVSQYNATILIYKRTDINSSMRILFDNRLYDIIDIIPDPTNNLYFRLLCKTGFTNG